MPDADTNKLLMVVIAILLPPVAVGIKCGVGLSILSSASSSRFSSGSPA